MQDHVYTLSANDLHTGHDAVFVCFQKKMIYWTFKKVNGIYDCKKFYLFNPSTLSLPWTRSAGPMKYQLWRSITWERSRIRCSDLVFLKLDEILSWLGVFCDRLILMRCARQRLEYFESTFSEKFAFSRSESVKYRAPFSPA